MKIVESGKSDTPVKSPKVSNVSALRGTSSPSAVVDRRRFLHISGLAAGTALAGAAAQAYAFRQAAAVEAAADRRVPQTEPPVTGAALATRKKTLFGIGYETWFIPGVGGDGWGTAEARPILGHYSSLDPKVIRQHAQWIHDAGFDFILIDWSNNLIANEVILVPEPAT